FPASPSLVSTFPAAPFFAAVLSRQFEWGRIERGGPMRRRSAFTLVELLVVIGIIALLIAILMPALSRAKEQANRVYCAGNLHNLGAAAQHFASEHKGLFPMTYRLPDDAFPYRMP